MYDSQLMRFTSIDPVFGKLQQPLTLHVYLYCTNDPLNGIDPTGEFASVAAYLFAKAVIGAVAGGYSAYTASDSGSDLKVDAVLLGAACGAVSSMLGPGFGGIIGGAALSAVTNSYAYYRRTGNIEIAGVAFFTGFAGGGITGSLMMGAGINDVGLISFIGGSLGGSLFTSYLSMPLAPLDSIEDIVEEKDRIDKLYEMEHDYR